MQIRASLVILLSVSCLTMLRAAESKYDPELQTWTLTNGWIEAKLQFSNGRLYAQSLRDVRNAETWRAPAGMPTSLIRMEAGGEAYDAQRLYTLVDQNTQPASPAGVRQQIVVQDLQRTAQFTLALELYDEQPVVRYRVLYKNLTGSRQYVTAANVLPWTFGDLRRRYTALRVNQWMVDDRPEDFETLQSVLDSNGTPVQLTSGANGEQCGWVAVRDGEMRGLFAGWEFDGRSKTTVRHSSAEGSLEFT